MVLADFVMDLVFYVSFNMVGRFWKSSRAVECGRGVNTCIGGDGCNKTKIS